jgi:hypothetical protein
MIWAISLCSDMCATRHAALQKPEAVILLTGSQRVSLVERTSTMCSVRVLVVASEMLLLLTYNVYLIFYYNVVEEYRKPARKPI